VARGVEPPEAVAEDAHGSGIDPSQRGLSGREACRGG
jgi:hypothetical protein